MEIGIKVTLDLSDRLHRLAEQLICCEEEERPEPEETELAFAESQTVETSAEAIGLIQKPKPEAKREEPAPSAKSEEPAPEAKSEESRVKSQEPKPEAKPEPKPEARPEAKAGARGMPMPGVETYLLQLLGEVPPPLLRDVHRPPVGGP